jgi:hypothetical protein
LHVGPTWGPDTVMIPSLGKERLEKWREAVKRGETVQCWVLPGSKPKPRLNAGFAPLDGEP